MPINRTVLAFTLSAVFYTGCLSKNPALDTTLWEMESLLEGKMLKVWYPRCLDTLHGGYLSDFDAYWNAIGPQEKFIVTQARHLWASSTAAYEFPHERTYRKAAEHGYTFLKEKMRDSTNGGFYTIRNKKGEPTDKWGYKEEKRTYGQAFVLYALAAYSKITPGEEPLTLAKELYHWIETHAYDTIYGGYFQFLTAEGVPFHSSAYPSNSSEYERFPYKDQNVIIHLLEAYTALYMQWPDPGLQTKLQDLIHLITRKIVTGTGYMNLLFLQDWTPLSYKDSTEVRFDLDHVSFGHDIETAYLLLEASEALGGYDYEHVVRTAKSLVDHSLTHGFDKEKGGLYEQGYYYSDTLTIVSSVKSWWPQAEALNTLSLFSKCFPGTGYQWYFDKQWGYISNAMIDWENGGWYVEGIDQNPSAKGRKKGHKWKSSYHTVRAVLSCIKRSKEQNK